MVLECSGQLFQPMRLVEVREQELVSLRYVSPKAGVPYREESKAELWSMTLDLLFSSDDLQLHFTHDMKGCV